MRNAVLKLLPEATIVIKTAAVSDYRPRATPGKKSSAPVRCRSNWSPRLTSWRNRREKTTQLIVGFAAETQNAAGERPQEAGSKSLDAIVVNDVSREGVGFDSDRNAVTIITQDDIVEVPETTKWEVAQRVLDQVVQLRKRTPGYDESLPFNRQHCHSNALRNLLSRAQLCSLSLQYLQPMARLSTRNSSALWLSVSVTTTSLGIYDFYRRAASATEVVDTVPQSSQNSEKKCPEPGATAVAEERSLTTSVAKPESGVNDPVEALKLIREDLGDCTRCVLHKQGRKQIVFGVGNPDADLMFIGEAPGADEDHAGRTVRRPRRATAHQHDQGHGAARATSLHREHHQVPSAGEPHARTRRVRNLFSVSDAADCRHQAEGDRGAGRGSG